MNQPFQDGILKKGLEKGRSLTYSFIYLKYIFSNVKQEKGIKNKLFHFFRIIFSNPIYMIKNICYVIK